MTDAWILVGRELRHWARQPFQLIVNLIFPIMLVLMFGYLFGGSMIVPGGGDYKEFLLPGMFAMTMAFGVEATFTAISTDANKGVTDRFRSMPMARSAVVLGRAGADMLDSAANLVVLMACGLLMGWSWHNGPVKAAAAVGLLLLLRFSLLWLGIYLGLLLRSPESVMALQILIWPISFLSNVFVSPGNMPTVLAKIAEWNPLTATVDSIRWLFGNPGGQDSIWLAIAWPLVIIVIFFPLSVRRYQRMSR
ncbi:ABC transporter permease [Allorhizocola rhizosphaerae]|uniref:ABC transporter permease n=1 Tax=Allorhizocola rhizosphaerae TaxID=1872709 RepID=UPI000E3EDA2B|nr:ABC transporter permease [Allorhizocola rhizosphaerae]